MIWVVVNGADHEGDWVGDDTLLFASKSAADAAAGRLSGGTRDPDCDYWYVPGKSEYWRVVGPLKIED